MNPIVKRVEGIFEGELTDDLEHLLRGRFVVLSNGPDGIVDEGCGALFSGDFDREGFASLFVRFGQRGCIHDGGATKSTSTGRRDDAYSRPLAKSD